MQRALSISFVSVAAFGVLSCTQPASPTSPSSAVSATPVNITWSCLTQLSAGERGIFGAGAHASPCAERSRLASFVTATDASTAPTNLAAIVNGTTVTLTWTVPPSPDVATSFVIEAGTTSGSSNIVVFDTTSAANLFTATAVPAGTYFVRVRGRNASGTSAPSNETTVVVDGGCPGGPPNAPSNLTWSTSGSALTLSWRAPGGCVPTGYVIEAGSTSGATNLANFNTGSSAVTFSAPNVPAGTFYIRVGASNGLSVGAPSNEITVTIGGSPPPGPTGVAGRWVGTAPDGIIVGPPEPGGGCDTEYDLELNLATTGNTVTGTATTRLRRVAVPGCEPLGSTQTWSLINGTVASDAISFTLQITSRPPTPDGYLDFSGRVTATRMTGNAVGRDDDGTPTRPGSFAVNRQ